MLPLAWMLFHTFQLLFMASFALAQNWAANPFVPPSAPLAVKMPFLQTWLPQGGANGSLSSEWPSFRGDSVGHPRNHSPVDPLANECVLLETYMDGDDQSRRPIIHLDGSPR